MLDSGSDAPTVTRYRTSLGQNTLTLTVAPSARAGSFEVRPDGTPVDDNSGRWANCLDGNHCASSRGRGFPAGREFAAWLGLTPLQKSTGGKKKFGAVSKRGERTIRRLLIIGASAVVQQASRRRAPKSSGLAQMLARKPKMLVTVALANKMGRVIWALLVKGGIYRTPAVAA